MVRPAVIRLHSTLANALAAVIGTRKCHDGALDPSSIVQI